jgi:hypothetical protein
MKRLRERGIVEQFEVAGPGELQDLLAGASAGERRELGAYLGEERFGRLHTAALTAHRRKAEPWAPPATTAWTVVVIPDLMGSALEARRGGVKVPVWPAPLALSDATTARGDGPGLEAGADETIRATGLLNPYYGELILRLAGLGHEVRPFAYDWRRDVEATAAELDAFLDRTCPGDRPVALVAHGLGGLVARALWLRRQGRALPGRVILLGTPNRGTDFAARLLAGVDPVFHRLAHLAAGGATPAADAADAPCGPPEAERRVLRAFRSFPSLYQMLAAYDPPAGGRDGRDGERHALRQAASYGAADVPVSQRELDGACDFRARLAGAVDPWRMVNVLGRGHPTWRLADHRRPDRTESYVWARGDGLVTEELGRLPGVDPYVVGSHHADLVASADVLGVVGTLLDRGRARPPRAQAGPTAAANGHGDSEPLFARLLHRVTIRGPAPDGRPSPDEQRLRDLAVEGLLARPQAGGVPARPAVGRREVRLRLRCGDLSRIDDLENAGAPESDAPPPVDVIAVGHYAGARPLRQEDLIDRSISREFWKQRREADHRPPPAGRLPDSERLLLQMEARGLIRGELGEFFFLPDPRDARRLIVMVGMGAGGRFGQPELVVTARELTWAVARLARRHLAARLIGTGARNLPVEQAVKGWLQGLAQVAHEVSAGSQDGEPLPSITFVEHESVRALEIDRVLARETDPQVWNDPCLSFRYAPMTPEQRNERGAEALEEARRLEENQLGRILRGVNGLDDKDDGATRQSRLSVERRGVGRRASGYSLAALTESASVPERDVRVAAAIAERAGRELAEEADRGAQLDRGQFLGRLLLPAEFRPHVFGGAPLVVTLDAASARLPWEMVARTGWDNSLPGGEEGQRDGTAGSLFLGMANGLTRRLRTAFAPPPAPPPPARRVLRVLVVADPAADAPLHGAAEEGHRVADLFERFNAHWADARNRVSVTRLIGPDEATITDVLRRVMADPYDVLHYAGHCTYRPDDPAGSGWVFSGGEVLSADLLNRIDRVPRFVFSNACESGVTPDRIEGRSVDLAPSFAEAFFARGVANIVCTAWPVDDQAALEFALTVYGELLGLWGSGAPARPGDAPDAKPLHEAMSEARRRVAGDEFGVTTWGAYQHYGDPLFRLFDPSQWCGHGSRRSSKDPG